MIMLNITPGIMCFLVLVCAHVVDAGGTLTNSSTHHSSVHCGVQLVPLPKRPPSVALRELTSFIVELLKLWLSRRSS